MTALTSENAIGFDTKTKNCLREGNYTHPTAKGLAVFDRFPVQTGKLGPG